MWGELNQDFRDDIGRVRAKGIRCPELDFFLCYREVPASWLKRTKLVLVVVVECRWE